MWERRLGLGWKASRRRSWCEEGLMRVVKVLFNSSPSTPPIRTSEFFIADLLRFSALLLDDDAVCICCCRCCIIFCSCCCCFLFCSCSANRLWYAHRNEPGWVVGEHMHVLFSLVDGTATLLFLWFFVTVIDCLPGDSGRCSKENLTEDDGDGGDCGVERYWPWSLTFTEEDAREPKFATDEEANAGECERDDVSLLLEEWKTIAIVEARERERKNRRESVCVCVVLVFIVGKRREREEKIVWFKSLLRRLHTLYPGISYVNREEEWGLYREEDGRGRTVIM